MRKQPRTPASLFALAFGVVYLVVAVYGFVMTGFSDFTSMHGPRLLGLFMVNPLHNTVHLVLAAAWLTAAPHHRAARVVNLAIGVVLGLVTVLGFFQVLTFLGIHSLGDPDNFLHLGTAALALYFGTIGAERLDLEPSSTGTAA